MEGQAIPGGDAETRPTTVVLDTGAGQVKTSGAADGEWSVHVRGGIRELWRAVCGGVATGPPRRRVMVDGTEVRLSRREFDLFAVLVRRTDRMFTKAELLEAVWGFAPRVGVDEQRVTATVRRLRARLAEAGAGELIATARGVGYGLAGAPGRADAEEGEARR
ncbi:MAG: winged helix-turn-helix transcriptional regulator [Actinobacteria bacterium]|nr:winged helix-turn-helix transcriptional regulator [Actinomycetota bacterium]